MGAANSALEPLSFLIGTWETQGKHPELGHNAFKGQASFEWFEDGAFILMRSSFEEPRIPTAVAVFGSDDSLRAIYMLYFDVRGVSRKYDVAIDAISWRWWRDEPGFAQRFTVTIAKDHRSMVGRGELSRDGSTWNGDLDVTYVRTG